MAPEYGATIGIFPVDEVTMDFLKMTGRANLVPLVEAYYKEQGLWYTAGQADPQYSDVLELDLSKVEPSLAGPARPQDRVALNQIPQSFEKSLSTLFSGKTEIQNKPVAVEYPAGHKYELTHGSVVIAAITSCTNTSNPNVLMAAGLLAKNAVEKGLHVKPWVKTSLAPGSQVVTDYLKESGLLPYLEALKFHVVGYGCTTCIGNCGRRSRSRFSPLWKQKL
jgi:aconitate hydratase